MHPTTSNGARGEHRPRGSVGEGRRPCPSEMRCALRHIWLDSQESLDATLFTITLADLVEGARDPACRPRLPIKRRQTNPRKGRTVASAKSLCPWVTITGGLATFWPGPVLPRTVRGRRDTVRASDPGLSSSPIWPTGAVRYIEHVPKGGTLTGRSTPWLPASSR
jgi:hypothetical protein